MGLIKNDGTYIKLEPDGTFMFFTSKEERMLVKNSSNSEDIIQKYDELLKEKYQLMFEAVTKLGLTNDDYENNWDVYYSRVSENPECKSFVDSYFDLMAEYDSYADDLFYQKGTQHEFPIMKEFFPDIETTIPNILYNGKIGISAETADEEYEQVKKLEIFGETTDY